MNKYSQKSFQPVCARVSPSLRQCLYRFDQGKSGVFAKSFSASCKIPIVQCILHNRYAGQIFVPKKFRSHNYVSTVQCAESRLLRPPVRVKNIRNYLWLINIYYKVALFRHFYSSFVPWLFVIPANHRIVADLLFVTVQEKNELFQKHLAFYGGICYNRCIIFI